MHSFTAVAVGTIGTEPKHVRTAEGLDVTTFRFCVTERRFDQDKRAWDDADKTWLTVVAYRRLARNIGASLHKGDRAIVAGRLRIKDWKTDDGRSGSSADLVADSVGPELAWGTASYERPPRSDQQAAGEPDADTAFDSADEPALLPAGAELPF